MAVLWTYVFSYVNETSQLKRKESCLNFEHSFVNCAQSWDHIAIPAVVTVSYKIFESELSGGIQKEENVVNTGRSKVHDTKLFVYISG